MPSIEKTVFISYRRENKFIALKVYDYLSSKGFDVFLDYQNVGRGDFEQIILGSVKSRAHFVLILTPLTLPRCVEAADWVLREIQTAIREQRNIIPLWFDGFDVADMDRYLPPDVATPLRRYNAFEIPNNTRLLDAALDVVIGDYLEQPVATVIHPPNQLVTDYEDIQRRETAAVTRAADDPSDLSPAEKLLQRADKHLRNEQYDLACADADAALDLEPDWYDALLLRGETYRLLGQLDKAVADFTAVLQLAPSTEVGLHVEALIGRGLSQSKHEAQIADFTQALQLDPDNVDAFLIRSAANLHRNPQAALDDLTIAIRLRPTDPELYVRRGDTYEWKEWYPKAITDYTSALEIEPTLYNALVERGRCYGKMKLDAEAMTDFERAIVLVPIDPSAYMARAWFYVDREDFERALEDASRAIELEPGASTYVNRARILESKKEYGRAASDYTLALADTPTDAHLYRMRGFCYSRIDRHRLAIIDFSESIRLDPNNFYSYWWRGRAHEMMNNLTDALEDYRQALEIEPDDNLSQSLIDEIQRKLQNL